MNPYRKKDPTIIDSDNVQNFIEAYEPVVEMLNRMNREPAFKERFMQATAGKHSRIRTAFIKQCVRDHGINILMENQKKIDQKIRQYKENRSKELANA